MSLKTIRADIAARIGLNLQVESEVLFINHEINDAAEELYIGYDLVGCLKENIFSFVNTDKIISLPYDVYSIRGIRYYDSKYKIPLNDQRPRYSNQGWSRLALNYREIGDSPLSRQLENFSILNFSIPLSVATDVVISLIGKTPNSARVQETVTIPAGSLSVNTTGNFETIFSIIKNDTCTYDITVQTADNTIVAIIPNSELVSRYKILQVLDDTISTGIENAGVEILYKPRFTPFQNDSDEFPCQGYDKAIFWKYMEHYYAGQKDGMEKATASYGKCQDVISQIARNAESGREMEVEFAANPFYGLYRPMRWTATKTW